jgi:hypothetical protein
MKEEEEEEEEEKWKRRRIKEEGYFCSKTYSLNFCMHFDAAGTKCAHHSKLIKKI